MFTEETPVKNNEGLKVPFRKTLLVILLVAMLGAIVSYITYQETLKYHLKITEDFARESSFLVNSNLEALRSELTIIACDEEVISLLSVSSSGEQNSALRHLNKLFKAALYSNSDILDVYLLDKYGNCVASTYPKIIGKNYSFRPYFKEALSKGEALYIAKGVVIRKLAVYLSRCIRSRSGDVLGVLVFRLSPRAILSQQGDISISSFFKGETGNSYLCCMVNQDGVFFSLNTLYSLVPITQTLKRKLHKTRQFPPEEVKSLGLPKTVWITLRKKGHTTFIYNNEMFAAWLSPLGSYDIGVLTIARVSSPNFPIWVPPLAFMLLFLILALSLGVAYYNNQKMKLEALQNIELEKKARGFEFLSQEIIATTNQGVWISDAITMEIKFANPALAKMLGMSEKEILSKTFFQLLSDEDAERLRRYCHRVSSASPHIEKDVLLKRRDGSTIPAHLNSSLLDTPSGPLRVAFVTNLSESLALREEVRKLSRAVESSEATIVITDTRGTIEYVNPAFTKNSGYTYEEAIGENPRILKSGVQDQAFYEEMWNTILSGKTWKGEICNKRKDGTLYWERAAISPIFDEDKITHFVAINQDITKEVELRQKLEEKANELNLILDNAEVGIFFMKERVIIRCNKTGAKMFGYNSPKEMLGRRGMEFYVNQEESDRIGQEIYAMIREGKQIVITEAEYRKKDGSTFWAKLIGRLIDPKDPEKGVIWLVEDISKEREMREDLRKRDAVLKAVSQASSKIVASANWKEGCKDLLDSLGNVAGLDLIVIRRLYEVKKERKLKGNVEEWWSKEGKYPQKEEGFEVNLDMPSFQKRKATLESRESFVASISNHLPGERDLLEHWGVKSTLVVPIIVFESLWGVISFNQSEYERKFSQFEIEAYKTVANIVAASIEKDLTEKKRLIEMRKTTALIETSSNVILRTDPKGKILFINAFGAKLFGFTPEEMVGKTIFEAIVQEEHKDSVERFLSYLRGGGAPFGSYTFENLTAHGKKIWLSWSVTPIVDDKNQLEEILWVAFDISKQKEIEENLRRAAEAKTRFLANMSHEIRTPLNAIIGMIQLLSETGLTKEQAQYASALHSSAKTLLSLINDVLDLSKIEADEVRVEKVPFNLRRLMEDLVQSFAYQVKEKKIELLYHLPVNTPYLLVGDSQKLGQILRNLVSNSLKFTEKGYISISCRQVSQQENQVELMFKVTDTGVGISEDKLEMIFKPFVQEDVSVTRRFGGTGLGLTITSRFVDLMGGKISVESKRGEGTTFYVSLPFTIDESSSDPYRDRWKAIANEVEVIVGSDNPVFRNCLRDMISAWGIRVQEAIECKEIGKAVTSHTANTTLVAIIDDSILTEDLMIKCKEVKEGDAAVVVSTWNISQCPWRDRGVSEKTAGCLAKPITETAVLETLETVVFGRELVRGRAGEAYELTSQGSGSILLVEDVPMNQLLARTVLEKEGYTVTIASNGLEALKLLSEQDFHLVLMDIQMPILDGLTTTKIIRACEEKRKVEETDLLPEVAKILDSLREKLEGGHIPIVAMTAHAFVEDVQRSIEAGMDAHISKPFEFQELRKVISELLGEKTLPVEETKPKKESPKDGEKGLKADIETVKEHLSSFYQLPEEDIEEILKTSSSSIGENLQEARSALESGDMERLRVVSHTLKGQLANLGLAQLSEIAKEMEMAANGEDRNFDYLSRREQLEDSLEALVGFREDV